MSTSEQSLRGAMVALRAMRREIEQRWKDEIDDAAQDLKLAEFLESQLAHVDTAIACVEFVAGAKPDATLAPTSTP